MGIISNNKSKLASIREGINYHLSYLGLSEMLPFICAPICEITNDAFFRVSYDMLYSVDGKRVEEPALDPNMHRWLFSKREEHWTLFPRDDVAIKNTAPFSNPPVFYFLDYPGEPMPRHIEAVMRALKKRFRNSVVTLFSHLPQQVDIYIAFGFNLKKNRERLLWNIAKSTILYSDEKGAVRKEVNAIIGKERRFKKAIGQILALAGEPFKEPEFSYCLMCGERVNRLNKNGRPIMFCSKTGTYANNCQNKLNARLDARGYNRAMKRRLYNELRSMLKHSPLSDFEDFKALHNDIYQRKPRKGANRG